MQRADFVSTFNYSKRCNETNSPLRVCINIVVQKNIILLYRRVTTFFFATDSLSVTNVYLKRAQLLKCYLLSSYYTY